jgi:hypothetical protein
MNVIVTWWCGELWSQSYNRYRSQKFQNLIISYIQVSHFLGLIGGLRRGLGVSGAWAPQLIKAHLASDQVTRCFT